MGFLFGGKSREEKEAQRQQAALTREQRGAQNFRLGAERELFGRAKGLLAPLEERGLALLTGDRETVLRQFSPMFSDLVERRQALQDRLTSELPRGGFQESLIAQTDVDLNRDISNLLAGAPELGSQIVGSLMSLLLGQAPVFGEGGTRAAGTAIGAGHSILESEAARRAAGGRLLGGLLGAVATPLGNSLGKRLAGGAGG